MPRFRYVVICPWWSQDHAPALRSRYVFSLPGDITFSHRKLKGNTISTPSRALSFSPSSSALRTMEGRTPPVHPRHHGVDDEFVCVPRKWWDETVTRLEETTATVAKLFREQVGENHR